MRGDGPSWLRRLPLLAVAACAAFLLWVWVFSDLQRQDKYIQTAAACTILYALALLWLLFLGPWPWRVRAVAVAAGLLPVLFLAATTRIRGVTGDLLPILEWRWAKRESPSRTPAPAPIPAAATNLADFPQFLGPGRDGVMAVNLRTNWAERQPKELWRRKVGPAWSAFAVSEHFAVTQEQDGENETVAAYHVLTGERLWVHSYPARYSTTIAGEGPRATPTISSNRVFTFGATGVLNCLQLADGKLVWTRNVLKDHGGSVPDWGMASSPLVTDEWVVVSVASEQSLAAYKRGDGELGWVTGSDKAGYSSPALLQLLGEEIIGNFNKHSIAGYQVKDGRELWKHPWPLAQPNVTLPLAVTSNLVFASTGYGRGSELLRLGENGGQWSVESVYKSNKLKSKFSNIFLIDGFIYGMDDGIMACLDIKDGSRRWKDGRYGHCQMILAGDLLVFVTEGGELKLVQPDPSELRELASVKVFNDKTWNPPALAGAYLLVRNDMEAACYLLPTADGP